MSHTPVIGTTVKLIVVRAVKEEERPFGHAVQMRPDQTRVPGTRTTFRPAHAQVPLLPDGHSVPVFADVRLLQAPIPPVAAQIVCIQSPRERKQTPFIATYWTTRKLWQAATGTYRVTRYAAENPLDSWEFRGIFDLSRQFPSNTWDDDGVIWEDSDSTIQYEIEIHPSELDDAAGIGEDDLYAIDPRVPLDMLVNRYHYDSVIKQLEER